MLFGGDSDTILTGFKLEQGNNATFHKLCGNRSANQKWKFSCANCKVLFDLYNTKLVFASFCLNRECVVGPLFPAKEALREDNKLRIEDRSAHDWYRFVLSFPAHLVRTYIDRFELGTNHTVLDPFCGTGTTLVECKKNGIQSYGIESNPMAAFASRTKVSWQINADSLVTHASDIAKLTLRKFAEEGINDEGGLPLFESTRQTSPKLRILHPELEKLLLNNSISPLPLHKTLLLLETLEEHKDDTFALYERLALAKCLVNEISNLHFGPEIGIGAIKKDAAVINPWFRAIKKIADDIRHLHQKAIVPAVVHQADARDMVTLFPPNSVDAIITSPPYPNEKDYTRTTRLSAPAGESASVSAFAVLRSYRNITSAFKNWRQFAPFA